MGLGHGKNYFLVDMTHNSIVFEGKAKDKDGDYSIYSTIDWQGRLKNNDSDRSVVSFIHIKDNIYNILINKGYYNYKTLFAGNSADKDGDYTVYSSNIMLQIAALKIARDWARFPLSKNSAFVKPHLSEINEDAKYLW
jgi:hypothetical protein